MKKLPIAETFKETFKLLWTRRLRVFQALIGAALILAALDTVQGSPSARHSNSSFSVLFFAAGNVVFMLFAITCHRIVLLGETAVPRWGIYSWSRRETRFLGWLFVGYFFYLGVMLLTAILAFPIAIPLSEFSGVSRQAGLNAFLASIVFPGSPASTPVVLPLSVPAVYVVARLAVLLPATAIGERRNMQWAWNITARNGWRLVIVVVLLPIGLYLTYAVLWGLVAAFFPLQRYLLIHFFINLLTYVVMAIEIAVLSVSFRFLISAAGDGQGAGRVLQPTTESDP